ncbi:50S ribosomal protein L24 [bacterium (Candidatus Torokbacteria) CG_4_10_14_0_2_um_filter_35_8]|nr:MAG: 50S ribosomal protein L24 [bacterium (Candidatus Torokbacteria) CG_4_10_14_0_2_um_filter_35_8]
MKIRKNDTVLVISGKDRGKKGKVTQTLPEKKKIVVEGMNKRIKHVRPRREGEKGQRVEIFAPFGVSNVKLVCGKCGKATRVGYKILKNKKKVRICKECREVINIKK